MTDWKHVLGFIVPSWNRGMEYECMRMAPAGTSIHISRIFHIDDSEETLLHMLDKAPGVAELLAHAKVDAICFGCTGGSFVKKGYDQELVDAIVKKTDIKTTTTSSAINDALKLLEIKNVAIATPYPDWLNDRQAEFLEDSGFKVVAKKGLNKEWPILLGPENAYNVAREADSDQAEGILISCTNFRSLEIIEKIEADSGKPVISSNTATMWKLLQMVDSKEKVTGAGQIFN